MSSCTHDCSSCSSNCASRDKKSFIKPPHAGTRVKRVIAVASGKGGVGKSLVTSLLAVRAASRGLKVGVLDADVTGPSIPRVFGIAERARGDENGIYPVCSKGGVKVMSMNCLLEHEEDPVVWRGSLIAGACLQFWTDVVWDELDLLFLDMPPGTGDVPLTVFQSIPLSGVVIVTTPQDLVEMIVGKAVNMAKMLNIPVLGVAENMSYFRCPGCGASHELFGASKAKTLAKKYGVPAYARIPLDPALACLADEGRIEEADTDALADIYFQIENSRPIEDRLA